MSDDAACPRAPVLVSACLLGTRCRYDGRDAGSAAVAAATAGVPVLLVCPEELGGLGTPRPAARLESGDGSDVLDGRARVLTLDGTDVTSAFLRGAARAVALARAAGATEAILKERSPSCGVDRVHREGGLVAGSGVTAAALARAGVRVRSAPEPVPAPRPTPHPVPAPAPEAAAATARAPALAPAATPADGGPSRRRREPRSTRAV